VAYRPPHHQLTHVWQNLVKIINFLKKGSTAEAFPKILTNLLILVFSFFLASPLEELIRKRSN